ncbi:phage distal tail protein [Streptosporangium vulgare]|uniref:Siphovirus-type tail component C-terminal domain-containing protein n=1 Tax=Streptosporangium vulgare TaxID=46190 RepID=A0ABV5TQU6_9ACTN
MARAGRSYPNRPIVVKGRYYRAADLVLDPFEVEAEWPALTVVTPSAQVLLGPFEVEAEWPPVTLFYGQSLSLAPFEVEAEWPEITVSTPIRPGDSITQAGQVEWNGTLWGPGTDVAVLIPIEGWRSTPTIDNLNVSKPSAHGAWNARKLAQQRLVTIRLQPNSASDPDMIDDLLDEIDAVTGIADDDTPLPLVVRLRGAPQLAFGQIIDRDPDIGGDYNAGVPTVTILIACGDARRYGIDRTGVSIPVGGTVQVINAGNTGTHPIIRIPGPVVNPTLVNAATGRILGFATTVEAGEQLEIDTDKGNATVNGDSIMSTLTGASAPVPGWVIKAGTNAITYTASSGGDSPLTLLYRDAWI